MVAHQIRQLFQYQEGKHRCNVWDSPTEEKCGLKKKPLLSDAELTYYEHKAKLKRTQVQHSLSRLDLLDPDDLLDYHIPDALLSGIECEQAKAKRGVQFDRKEPFGERSRRHSPVSGTNRPFPESLSPLESRRRLEEQNATKGARGSKNFDPYDSWGESDEFRDALRQQGKTTTEFQKIDGDAVCRFDNREERQLLGQAGRCIGFISHLLSNWQHCSEWLTGCFCFFQVFERNRDHHLVNASKELGLKIQKKRHSQKVQDHDLEALKQSRG